MQHRSISLALSFTLLAAFGAADRAQAAPTKQKKVKADATVPAVSRDQVEIVFVLDTTGSMGGLIDGAKKKIWFIANEVLRSERQPSLKVGLVAYRDKGDAYVTKSLPLTNDLDKVYTELMSFRAGGGGDGPEHVNAGLDAAVTKQPWSQGKDVLKMVFLVGDAPPHMDYDDDRKHEVISKDAVANNIYIHTIQCGGDPNTKLAWTKIARNSEGRYAAIKQTGGVVAKATPFDAELGRLAAELDDTTVEIGEDRKARASTRRAAKKFAGAAPASVAAERAMVKAKVKVSADKDLVSLYEAEGEEAIAKLDDKALPVAIAKKPASQRVAHVKRMAKKRKALRSKIQALEKKRAGYIKEEARTAAPAEAAFDGEVADMIAGSME